MVAILIVTLANVAVAQSGSRGGIGGGSGIGGGPGGGGLASPEPKRERTRLPNFAPATTIPIRKIQIVGNKSIPTERITTMLHSREGRYYDPETVQRDVRTLIASGMFQHVHTYKGDIDGGKSITFEVVERPTIAYVRFIGNESIKDKKLLKDMSIKPGDPLNGFAVEEARRQLQETYSGKGYADVHIEVIEGSEAKDRGVVFQVHEGSVQRIYKVGFVGNKIATDSRLKTQVKSKPGILWLIGGKVQKDQIDQDIDRLTAYYRSLGFFRARVGRQVAFNEDRDWMTLNFVIDEGERYRIRQIRADGSKKVAANELMQAIEARQGEYFNLGRMQRDLNTIRDHYGSQGYIFADIKAEPRFQEEPGLIDVVFKIDEGKQYRVGRVLVNIEGENPHTRQSVVLNRLSIRPGDVLDIRQLRKSERRLQSSALFLHDPATGVTPKIVVRPPTPDETRVAVEGPGTVRGQSPHTTYRPPVADVIISGRINPNYRPETKTSAPQPIKRSGNPNPLRSFLLPGAQR